MPRRAQSLRLVVPSLVVLAAFACGDIRASSDEDVDGGSVSPDGTSKSDASNASTDGAKPEPQRDASADAKATADERCSSLPAPDAAVPDREWAQWRLPESSPDAGTYRVDGAAVCDRTTGLLWERAPTTPKTWDDALAYCETLNLQGFTDWRMPTRIELLSLVDFGTSKPAISGAAFPGTVIDAGTPESRYWTTTRYPTLALRRYVVSFDFGQALTVVKDEVHAVRCVRGGP